MTSRNIWPPLRASGHPSESDPGSPYIRAGFILNLKCICSPYTDHPPPMSPYKSGSLMSRQLSGHLCRNYENKAPSPRASAPQKGPTLSLESLDSEFVPLKSSPAGDHNTPSYLLPRALSTYSASPRKELPPELKEPSLLPTKFLCLEWVGTGSLASLLWF